MVRVFNFSRTSHHIKVLFIFPTAPRGELNTGPFLRISPTAVRSPWHAVIDVINAVVKLKKCWGRRCGNCPPFRAWPRINYSPHNVSMADSRSHLRSHNLLSDLHQTVIYDFRKGNEFLMNEAQTWLNKNILTLYRTRGSTMTCLAKLGLEPPLSGVRTDVPEPCSRSGLSTSGPPNSCNCCRKQQSIASIPSSTWNTKITIDYHAPFPDGRNVEIRWNSWINSLQILPYFWLTF